MSSQQFCLKWNNHTTNMLNVFEHLLSTEALVDVTLACDGLSLKAHKMVLSACSPFFQSLFLENPCKHPIVIMKDMSYKDLKAIIDFMYRGEVNVSQDQLSALLKTAETLKVKGLAEVTGENRQAAGVVQQEVSTPQTNSTPSSQQNSQSMRPESPPMHGKRKRGRPRKRSLSDSNRSDDELVPSKIKEPESPEVEELSGDGSMDGGEMLRSNSSSQSQVPSVNTYSSSKHHSSAPSHLVNSQDEAPSGDDNEFEVEPSKLLEQTLTTDNVPSNASSNLASSFNLPSSSGIEISQVGDSQALVPVSASSDGLSSTLQGPDSPQDIKPAILTFDDSQMSPVAGPSHQSSDRSMMMYMDQSSMPGPSNYQDQSLVQHDSQPQEDSTTNNALNTSKKAELVTIPKSAKIYVLKKNSWHAIEDQKNRPNKQPLRPPQESDESFDEDEEVSVIRKQPAKRLRKKRSRTNTITPNLHNVTTELPLLAEVKMEPPDEDACDSAESYLINALQEGTVTDSFPLLSPEPFTKEKTSPETCYLDSDWARNFRIPWEMMPSDLMWSAKQRERPSPSLRRMMIRIICEEIRKITHLPGRRALFVIAKKVVDAYPASFADSLCGEIVGAGNESLWKQLINRIENMNRLRQPEHVKRKKLLLSYREPPSDPLQKCKKRKYPLHDGCINWQPVPPPYETEASQLRKRQQLKQMEGLSLTGNNKEKALQLLQETFFLQRVQINSQLEIPRLMQEWPLLFWKDGFLAHFSQVVGIDLVAKFSASLLVKGPNILAYLDNATGFTPNHSLRAAFAEIIDDSEGVSDYNESGVGINMWYKKKRMLASDLILLIMGYFNEDKDLLFRRDNRIGVSDEEDLDVPPNPCIIYYGQKLNSSKIFKLAIGRRIVCSDITTFVDGILLLFASFYCFDIEYPAPVYASLEFIQRCLFGINPGQHALKRMAINPRVLTLLNEISDFEQLRK